MQSGKESETIEEMLSKHDWYGQSVQVNSDPLVDSGTGKKLAWRTFVYDRNPDLKELPNKQELFNIHWQQIENQLWKDGFVVDKRVEPKIVIAEDQKRYVIAVVCEPQFNGTIIDDPQTLQEILPKPI